MSRPPPVLPLVSNSVYEMEVENVSSTATNPQKSSPLPQQRANDTVALCRHVHAPPETTLCLLGLVRCSTGGHYCFACRQFLDTSRSLEPCMSHAFHPTHLNNIAQKYAIRFGNVPLNLIQAFLSDVLGAMKSDGLSLDKKQYLLTAKDNKSSCPRHTAARKNSLVFRHSNRSVNRVSRRLVMKFEADAANNDVTARPRRLFDRLSSRANQRAITKPRRDPHRFSSTMTDYTVPALSADALADQLAAMLYIQPFQNSLRSLAEALPSPEPQCPSEVTAGVPTSKDIASSAG